MVSYADWRLVDHAACDADRCVLTCLSFRRSSTLRTLTHQLAAAMPSISRPLSPHAFRSVFFHHRRGVFLGKEVGRNITRVSPDDMAAALSDTSKDLLSNASGAHSWLSQVTSRPPLRAASGSKRKREATDDNADAVNDAPTEVDRSEQPSSAPSQRRRSESARPDDGLRKLSDLELAEGDVLECLIGPPGSVQKNLNQLRDDRAPPPGAFVATATAAAPPVPRRDMYRRGDERQSPPHWSRDVDLSQAPERGSSHRIPDRWYDRSPPPPRRQPDSFPRRQRPPHMT